MWPCITDSRYQLQALALSTMPVFVKDYDTLYMLSVALERVIKSEEVPLCIVICNVLCSVFLH